MQPSAAPSTPACRPSLCQYAAPPIAITAASARSVAPGSSSAISAEKFPAREAWRNARTSSSCRRVTASRPGEAPRTRRRARLASCRAASGRPSDDRGDVVEGHVEHVVQHECDAICRRQCVEQNQQSHADRIGENGFFFGALGGSDCGDIAAWIVRGQLLAPALAPFQRIEADARNDGREPAFEIRNASKRPRGGCAAKLSCSASSDSAADPNIRSAMRRKRGLAASKRSASRSASSNKIPPARPSRFTPLDPS